MLSKPGLVIELDGKLIGTHKPVGMLIVTTA